MTLWFATLDSPESFQSCLVATRDYPAMDSGLSEDETRERSAERRKIIAEAEGRARNAMVSHYGEFELSRVYIEQPGDTMHRVNRSNED